MVFKQEDSGKNFVAESQARHTKGRLVGAATSEERKD